MQNEFNELAFEFFLLFAKFEFSLKLLEYRKVLSNNSVTPDWERFSSTIGKSIFNSKNKDVINAVKYIQENPPKRQVVINNMLCWQNVNNCTKNATSLFGHIRRVRNNLFHGGKFGGNWLEPDRSKLLLTYSLMILNELIQLNTELSEAIKSSRI